LKNLESGGRLVINAIRKENRDRGSLLNLITRNIYGWKKRLKVSQMSQAEMYGNFLSWLLKIPLKPEIQEYPLDQANHALIELKERKIRGAKVLAIN